ncbi:MAG: hypothetical protein AAGU75_21430 [Bacillota bacterium]
MKKYGFRDDSPSTFIALVNLEVKQKEILLRQIRVKRKGGFS